MLVLVMNCWRPCWSRSHFACHSSLWIIISKVSEIKEQAVTSIQVFTWQYFLWLGVRIRVWVLAGCLRPSTQMGTWEIPRIRLQVTHRLAGAYVANWVAAVCAQFLSDLLVVTQCKCDYNFKYFFRHGCPNIFIGSIVMQWSVI